MKSDLIYRGDALETFDKWTVKPGGELFNAIKSVAKGLVENVPAVEVNPVIHAHWVFTTRATEIGWLSCNCNCSWCGHFAEELNLGWNYCPWCGAKMDEE